MTKLEFITSLRSKARSNALHVLRKDASTYSSVRERKRMKESSLLTTSGAFMTLIHLRRTTSRARLRSACMRLSED